MKISRYVSMRVLTLVAQTHHVYTVTLTVWPYYTTVAKLRNLRDGPLKVQCSIYIHVQTHT